MCYFNYPPFNYPPQCPNCNYCPCCGKSRNVTPNVTWNGCGTISPRNSDKDTTNINGYGGPQDLSGNNK